MKALFYTFSNLFLITLRTGFGISSRRDNISKGNTISKGSHSLLLSEYDMKYLDLMLDSGANQGR